MSENATYSEIQDYVIEKKIDKKTGIILKSRMLARDELRFIVITIIISIVLVFSNSQAYSQSANETLTQLNNQTDVMELKENTLTNQIIVTESNEKTELFEIKESLKNLESKISAHDNTSHYEGMISYVVGGSMTIFGIYLTIRQSLENKKRHNEEKNKIQKLENDIKWILGDILEHIEPLEKNPPKDEQLKSKLGWRRINDLIKKLRIMIEPVAKDLRGDLGKQLIGYIVDMEKQHEQALSNEKVYLTVAKNATEKSLNKYFPEFKEERKTARDDEIAHLEQEMEKNRAAEEEAHQEFYDEMRLDALASEYEEEQSRINSEDSEMQDLETEKDMEEYSMDIEDDEENDYRGK